MNLIALFLRHGPAALAFLRQHGSLILELIEAVAPVLRKMVQEDVPHAATLLALLDRTSEIVAGLGQFEAPVPRSETSGG